MIVYIVTYFNESGVAIEDPYTNKSKAIKEQKRLIKQHKNWVKGLSKEAETESENVWISKRDIPISREGILIALTRCE
tara:strand:- start:1344 stop:1577 length:234 start_codon:yes stop_codon:yes gene_type:complete